MTESIAHVDAPGIGGDLRTGIVAGHERLDPAIVADHDQRVIDRHTLRRIEHMRGGDDGCSVGAGGRGECRQRGESPFHERPLSG